MVPLLFRLLKNKTEGVACSAGVSPASSEVQ